MKKTLFLSLLLLAGNLSAQTTPHLGITKKTPELRALTNARIITAPGKLIENGTLVIDNGKVIAVGKDAVIPAGARIIDLGGKTIYPGFVEPFSEYGLEAVPEPKKRNGRKPVYKGSRIGCNAWNDAIHAQENWVESFKPDKKAAKAFLKQGFTTVQSANLDGIWRGRSFVTSLCDGLPNDQVIRPYSMHFASFDKGDSPQDYPSSMMGSIALLRQTMLDVDWYARAHAAHAKNPEQKLPEFNTAIEALTGIAGETVMFYTDDELSLLRADRFAKEFSQPVVLFGSGYEYARINDIAATGRTLIIPVSFPKTPEVGTLEDELDISLADLRHWERAPYNAAVLEQNNIRFAFTTYELEKKDKFLENVRLAVERGLSKETALAALTTIPAEICGVQKIAGTLEPGKMADFFVCNGDIFDDSTSIYSIWTHGVSEEFEALEKIDFSGKYSMEIGHQLFDLILEEEDKDYDASWGAASSGDAESAETEMKGKIKTDDNSAKLDNVTTDRNLLQFAVALDDFDIAGVARFSGRKIDDKISGRVFLGDGSQSRWSAVRTGDVEKEEDDDDGEDAAKENTETTEVKNGDAVPISRLSFPNTAYGLENLPVAENLHIKNGTVWTSEDAGILENTDVIIKNGKFEKIGSNLETPAGYRVIDATGKHVTAGIIDEHSHVAISAGVNEGSVAVTSEVRIGDVVNSDDISMYRSLAGGTTMARLLHGSANPIGGQAQIIKFRWGSSPEGLKYAKAPPSIKFALGENVKQSNWGSEFRSRYPQTRMGVENVMKDAFQNAREYEKDWQEYNALGRKDRQRTVPPRKNLRLDALVEILNSERFITCHSYVQSEILMLMRLAEQFGFRIRTFTHILEGYKVAEEMAKHGAGGASFSDWWAYKFEVYDAIPYNPCIMMEKGVTVAVNSDSRDLQRRLNQEAAKSVQYCGMSEEDAWKMVTINPAWQLGVDQWCGSIKAGKDADFVIWSDNPLSIYARAEQTWVEGAQYFDLQKDIVTREEIKLEQAALIQKILTESKNDGDSGGKYKKRDKAWHCDDFLDVWVDGTEGRTQ